MEFSLDLETKHKKKATYTINPDLLDEFDKLCKSKKWKKAQVIEKLMEQLIKQESSILTCSK